MHLCIFEDTRYKNFLPLVYFRPVFDLRCGALNLRQKIASTFHDAKISLSVRPALVNHLRTKCVDCEEYRGHPINKPVNEDTWFVNGRMIAGDELSTLVRKYSGDDRVFMCKGEVAAAFVRKSTLRKFGIPASPSAIEKMLLDLPSRAWNAVLVHYPWELVHRTAEEIPNDFHRMKKQSKRSGILGKIYSGAHLLERKNIIVGKGSVVKPGVAIDAEKGPVIIGEHVTIMPNAVIEGPAYIGDHSLIKVGAKIYHGTSIGNYCKIGGEVDASIIQSYSNKQHDGFLGHSYLGSFVNLGADTNTSDLKNTYTEVSVQLNGETVETGELFVGLTMGDHSKTGINVMFDTGSVVGISCNVFGAGTPPKELPSFAWGEKATFSVYRIEKALETAKLVMKRRGIQLSKTYEKLFREVFVLTGNDRKHTGIK